MKRVACLIAFFLTLFGFGIAKADIAVKNANALYQRGLAVSGHCKAVKIRTQENARLIVVRPDPETTTRVVFSQRGSLAVEFLGGGVMCGNSISLPSSQTVTDADGDGMPETVQVDACTYKVSELANTPESWRSFLTEKKVAAEQAIIACEKRKK